MFFIFVKKFLNNKKDFKFIFEWHNKKIKFHLRYVIDIAVLREIFLDKEYEWFPAKEPKVIIDLGAHFGDTSIYYSALFPDAKIISVEPSPENYERLVLNTKDNPNIIPLQAAIGSSVGTIDLHIVPSGFGHSVVKRDGVTKTIKVRQVTLKSLFEEYSINNADIIKFDIEGAEFDLFKDLNLSEYSNNYIGEVHEDMSSVNLEDFVNYFKSFKVYIDTISGNKRHLIRAKYEG